MQVSELGLDSHNALLPWVFYSRACVRYGCQNSIAAVRSFRPHTADSSIHTKDQLRETLAQITQMKTPASTVIYSEESIKRLKTER